MKKSFGIFLSIYILIQMNNLLYSQDDRWVYILSVDEKTLLIDKNTLVCDEYGNYIVWEKIICSLNCEDDYKTLNHTTVKFKFYKDRTIQALCFIKYYTDGSIESYKNPSRIDDIVPESVAEITYNFIIKNYPCK